MKKFQKGTKTNNINCLQTYTMVYCYIQEFVLNIRLHTYPVQSITIFFRIGSIVVCVYATIKLYQLLNVWFVISNSTNIFKIILSLSIHIFLQISLVLCRMSLIFRYVNVRCTLEIVMPILEFVSGKDSAHKGMLNEPISAKWV